MEYRYRLSFQSRSSEDVHKIVKEISEVGLDISGYDSQLKELEVVVSQEELRWIEQWLLPEQVSFFPMEWGGQLFAPDSRYLNPAEVAEELQNIAQAHSQYAQRIEIGRSFNGQPIYALLISLEGTQDYHRFLKKPIFLVDGLHHAREVVTPEISIEFAKQVLQTVSQADSLLQSWNFVLIPMLNVDGSEIVWNQNSYWRKNARAENGSVFGVDLNRNYDYRWSDCNGSSGRRSSDTFRGDAAASEPETLALQGLAERLRPAVYLSYHSFGEMVLYPYSCDNAYTDQKDFVTQVAQAFGAQLPRHRGSGTYEVGAPWEILYAVDGDSMSFMQASFGAFSLSLEIGTAFQPSYSERDTIVQTNVNALKWLAQDLSSRILAVQVLDAQTGTPTHARIEIQELNSSQGELPYRTNEAGYFFKILRPEQFTLRIKSEKGENEKLIDLRSGSQFLEITL